MNGYQTNSDDSFTFDIESTSSSSDLDPSNGKSFSSLSGRKLLKQRSSLFSDEADQDDDLLQRVIKDAGCWAAEVVYVQLWVMNEDSTRLVRPEAGWWLDEVFHQCEPQSKCPLCRLTKKSHEDYLPAEPLPIGVGLAGSLWAAVQQKRDGIVWRDIHSIASDPFQPWNPRLQLLDQCGFGMAAAVPFSVLGEEGILVFITRKNVNMERLQSPTNESFLFSAAQLIGSTFVFRGPKLEAKEERRAFLKNSLRRAKNKILALRAFGCNLSDYTETQRLLPHSGNKPSISKSKSNDNLFGLSWCHSPTDCIPPSWIKQSHRAKSFVCTTIKKFKGAGVSPPPASGYRQAAWTLFGTFVTASILTNLNVYLAVSYDMDHTFSLPPFGALLTLLYGLTAAPVSQPRNVILGQTMSMSISILISYATFIPLWARQSLAISLSVSGMVKLGIIHPPAGAAAMLFSTGKFGWMNMAFMLVANVVAIFAATVINNMSNKRQYPNYWGFQDFVNLLFSCLKDGRKKKSLTTFNDVSLGKEPSLLGKPVMLPLATDVIGSRRSSWFE